MVQNGAKRKRHHNRQTQGFTCQRETVKIAWLFGSLTRRDSIRDIDLAVHSEPELTFKEFLNLNAQIELELGLPVDMVEIARVPEVMKDKIYTSGLLIKGGKKT
jgi:predicted nucleotidyltransferase